MQPEPELRDREMQLKMKALRARDLQLWSIGLLVVLVMATGFVSLVLPRMVWGDTFRLQIPYLPQLVFGLIALTVLFNLYAFEQRRVLNDARDSLLQALLARERKASLPLIDSQTQLFNRHFLEHLLRKETARVERRGGSLALALVQVLGVRAVSRTLGEVAADQYMVASTELLERILPPLTTLVRYDERSFLGLMPDTEAAQAAEALEEVSRAMDAWNRDSGRAHRMSMVSSYEIYGQGADVGSLLRHLEQDVRRRRQEVQRTVGSMSPHCLFLACSEEVIRNLRPQFESLGVAVEVCAASAEGLEALRRQKFEAVVLDCEDPAIITQLIEDLRALPSAKGALLLAVIGDGIGVEAAFRMGANFVLTKPLLPETTARSLRVAYGLMLAERRRYFRHQIELLLQVTADKRQFEATLTNLSEGGLALCTSEPVEPGQRANLRFTLPGNKRPIEIKGEVAWRDARGRAGVRFVSMTQDARRSLDEWLLQRLQTEVEASREVPPGPSPEKTRAAAAANPLR